MAVVQRSKVISSLEVPRFTQNAITEFEWEVKSFREQLSAATNMDVLPGPMFGIQGTARSHLPSLQERAWLRFDGMNDSCYTLQLSSMKHVSVNIETKVASGSFEMTSRETFEPKPDDVFWNLLVIVRDSDIGRAIAELNAVSVLVRVTTVSAVGQPTHNAVEQNKLVVLPAPTLASNLQASLNSTDFSDISLKSSDGGSFPAHRQLLAMRSPVFKAMFYGQMCEATTGIAQIDASSGSLKQLLAFIYTDEVEESEVETFGSELYELGVQYELPRLAELVKEQFFRTLAVENVCERFTLAVRFSLKELEKACKKLIKDSIGAVKDTKGWLMIMQDVAVIRRLMDFGSSQDDDADVSPRKVKRPRLESTVPNAP